MANTSLEAFGLTVGDLPSTSYSDKPYPKKVKGRTVHIDADFMAYQVSAESKEELDPTNDKPRKSFDDMCHNASMVANHLRALGGGEFYVCHLTPTGSNKGGREEQAMQKEYQANRKDRDNNPEFLDAVRKWIGQNLNGAIHMDQEADDGMAQAAWNAEDPNLVVIASKDKDLLMVPGLHLNVDTGTISQADDNFGYIELDRSKSSPNVIGLGTKFFWAQCLMGDTADNIQGVPKVAGKSFLKADATAAYIKDVATVRKMVEDKTAKHLITECAAYKRIKAAHAKMKSCGPVLTYNLLFQVKSDKEAFQLVKSIWQETENAGYVFKDWRTGNKISATQALLSDMKLLWMRRNKNPDDVLVWLKEQLNG